MLFSISDYGFWTLLKVCQGRGYWLQIAAQIASAKAVLILYHRFPLQTTPVIFPPVTCNIRLLATYDCCQAHGIMMYSCWLGTSISSVTSVHGKAAMVMPCGTFRMGDFTGFYQQPWEFTGIPSSENNNLKSKVKMIRSWYLCVPRNGPQKKMQFQLVVLKLEPRD